ncbi:hypothetical protein JHK82_031925 [Glycine max]|nr:hypothetical protein JHK85_032590 [Glycine max]KAG5125188.1 hypothetical protein JHK82_031925 [Glycine max]
MNPIISAARFWVGRRACFYWTWGWSRHCCRASFRRDCMTTGGRGRNTRCFITGAYLSNLMMNDHKGLTTMKFDSLRSSGAECFDINSTMSMGVIELLTEVWEYLLPAERLCSQEIGKLEFKRGKINRRFHFRQEVCMTLDFHTNKKLLEEVAIIPSKRLRNKIVGFSTHLMKRI